MSNSFVHVDQSTQHAGVERAEAVVTQLRDARSRLNGARGMAAILLAAVVGAIFVVVDRMAANLEDGEMLAIWAVVSALFFVALAVGASALRPVGARLGAAWKLSSERRAQARADAQFMAYAAFDPRVMHDLQVAISRHEEQNPTEVDVAPRAQRQLAGDLYEATRRARMSHYY